MEEKEILEKNITVTLCMSNNLGVVHLVQVGGQTLSKMICELSSIPDIPIQHSDSQVDVVGQDIYICSDRKFFDSIKGCFTHLSWSAINELPKFSIDSEINYSFVVSY